MYWKRKWVSSTDTSCLVVAHPHQFGSSGVRRDGVGQDGIIHLLIRYHLKKLKGKHFNSFTFI